MHVQEDTEIGLRIRVLREERGFSQRELARASGLSPNTLSLIERGHTSPTASTLQKLAGALHVSISAFFEPDQSLTSRQAVFTRAGERPATHFGRARAEALGAPGDPEALMTPLLIKVGAGESSGALMTHSGHEFAYCLMGRMLYLVGDDAFLLEPGDSLLFDASQPHRWHNPTPEPAEILVVLALMKDRLDEIH